MTKDEAYFTYAHFRKSDGSIFYIGKGQANRHLSHANRNQYWHRTVNKHGLIVEKLDCWENEIDALDQEKYLIKFFKDLGYSLVNLTDGGEGLYNPSKEIRNKMSKNNAMKRPEVAKKISDARKGKKLSEKHKEKLSKVQTGRKLSDKTKAKMSARWKKGISDEMRLKMSESAKKAWAKRKGIVNE